MKRLPSHPAPEFARAIEGIESLAKIAGVDACRDALATATANLVIEEFGTNNRVIPARGRVCIQRLLGKKCQSQYRFCECKPPGADHASLWAQDGEPKYYVTEHYRIERAVLEKAAEFVRVHELEFEIVGGTGIHFPSKCFAIIYWNPKVPRF